MVWTGGRQGDLAAAIEAMFDQADAHWPDRSRVSDGTLGDTAHASRTSDHNPKAPNPPGWVDAGDLTYDPDHGVDHFVLAEAMRLRRDKRIKYVIFFGKVFKSYVDSAGRPAWEWQPYTGPNAHKQHMHVSVTPEGRSDTSPWFPTPEDDMTPEQDARLKRIESQLGGNIPQIRAAADAVPTAEQVAAAVVKALPPSSGGSAPTLAEIQAAVRTVVRSELGFLRPGE